MEYDNLRDRKLTLLEEQKLASDRLHNLLTVRGDGNSNDDGCIENSRKLMKNLDAAIVSSKQPGYFSYHEGSMLVKNVERRDELGLLAGKIQSLGKELDDVNQSMLELERQHQDRMLNSEPPKLGSLDQWFATYGKAESGIVSTQGLTSELHPSKKVYGGTKHHRAFKSRAVAFKQGQLTK